MSGFEAGVLAGLALGFLAGAGAVIIYANGLIDEGRLVWARGRFYEPKRGPRNPIPPSERDTAGLPPRKPHNMMERELVPLATPNPAAHHHANGYRGRCCDEAAAEARMAHERRPWRGGR